MGPSALFSVVQYVLSEHLANAKHRTGTKGPTKPVGQKGLTFFADLRYWRLMQMVFNFIFFKLLDL